MTTMIVQLAMMLTMTAIVCVIPVTAMSHSPFYMGTTTIEKGEGLIAVTGIMQIIVVIVNIIASWTIIIVMHIIVTMIEGALVVDSRRMMMSRTMMNSMGE